VNTIEPSAVPAKGQQRVLVRQLVHMQQRLSLYPLLTHLSVTLNFPHKNLPATRPFVKILLTTCVAVAKTLMIQLLAVDDAVHL